MTTQQQTPTVIRNGKQYDYAGLTGMETVQGRDCWRVRATGAKETNLFPVGLDFVFDAACRAYEAEIAANAAARKSAIKAHDDVYNDGGEGYNPNAR